jgi:hypothetical protein
MTEYYPDRWCVLQIEEADATVYKVLGGWSGGYLYGGSWRINSGIVRAEQAPGEVRFHGGSGSVYICPESQYGVNMASSGILSELQQLDNVTVTVLPENTNWQEITYE